MNEKTIALIRKLQALADRGIGGEKYNAQKALEKFLAKNNLTIEDLERIDIKEYNFKQVPARYRYIFFGIVLSTIAGLKTYKKSKSFYWIECTEAQSVEVKMKYDFYKRAFDRQLQTFTTAFCFKNDLTHKVDSLSQLTEEEIEEIRKAQAMARGMEASTYHKRLTK